jgi:hypothetical protein
MDPNLDFDLNIACGQKLNKFLQMYIVQYTNVVVCSE